MATSFIRSYELKLKSITGLAKLTLAQSAGVPGLAIEFNIEKKNTTDPQSATISIYNPANKTIGIFQQGGIITLKAGYDKDIAGIFHGQIRSTTISSDRVNTILTIEALSYTQPSKQINDFIPAGSTIAQVVDKLVKYIVDNVPAVDGINPYTIQSVSDYFAPVILSKDVFQLLTEVLRPIGYEYMVESGYLTISPIGSGVLTAPVVVSPQSGLMGIPKKISELGNDGQTNKQGIEFKSILNYAFNTKRKVDLRSKVINGLYVVDSLQFTGNSFEGEWVTNVRCLNG